MANNSGSLASCGGVTKTGSPCSRSGGEDGWCKTHRPAATMSLSEAVATGDRLKALQALRDRLADEVGRVADDGFCPACKRGSSSVAPLAKQLRDVLGELADLAPTVRKDPVRDELERKREERKAKAV
jgi:hypothetical protein